MTSDIDRVLNEVILSSSVQSAIEIVQSAFDLGHVTLHLVSNLKNALDNPFVRTTYPANWVSHYLLNNYVLNDPVLNRATSAEEPFNWAELEPTDAEMKVIIAAREFRIGQSGYTIPRTDKLGRKSILSINSTTPADEWLEFLDINAADIESLATDLHVKAVAEAFADTTDVPQLSPREYECLKWTAQGKTYSEIAIILDLSEHTVRSYLKMTRLKLDSVSLAQAVAKASSMQII